MTAEKPKQEQMSKSRGKTPKVNMYRTDKQWTMDIYMAVRTLNNKCLNLRTRKTAVRIQKEEEAEKLLKNTHTIRYLIDTEPKQAKGEIWEWKNQSN